jgi:hypothetical protein
MVHGASEGAVGAAFAMPIEAGKVLEFVEALHADRAAFADAIPPTFLTSAFFWEARVPGADVKDQVGFDPARSVHAEQEFIFHGPPPAPGVTLDGRSRVARIYEKTNRQGTLLTFVDIVTEFRDRDGALRAESLMRAIEFPP